MKKWTKPELKVLNTDKTLGVDKFYSGMNFTPGTALNHRRWKDCKTST